MKKFILPILLMTPCVFGQSVVGPAGTYTAILSAAGKLNFPSPYTGPAGTYNVTVPGPVTITQTSTSLLFTWGTPPTPIPPAPIPPSPTPITSHLYALTIFDSANDLSTLDQKALKTSSTIVPALKALNCDFVFCDKSSEAFATWIPTKFSDGSPVTFPVLQIISVDTGTNVGDQVEAITLPTNETAVIAEVNKLRIVGKKVVK